jgi:hypothetical protein
MHPQRAQMQLEAIVAKIEDLANVEQRPAMEARTMALLVAPKPVVFQRLAQAQREKKTDDKDHHHTESTQSLNVDEEALHEPDDDDDDDDDDGDDTEAAADDAKA